MWIGAIPTSQSHMLEEHKILMKCKSKPLKDIIMCGKMKYCCAWYA